MVRGKALAKQAVESLPAKTDEVREEMERLRGAYLSIPGRVRRWFLAALAEGDHVLAWRLTQSDEEDFRPALLDRLKPEMKDWWVWAEYVQGALLEWRSRFPEFDELYAAYLSRSAVVRQAVEHLRFEQLQMKAIEVVEGALLSQNEWARMNAATKILQVGGYLQGGGGDSRIRPQEKRKDAEEERPRMPSIRVLNEGDKTGVEVRYDG